MYTYMYVHIYIYICYVYIHIHVYIYIYIYCMIIYIYMYIHTLLSIYIHVCMWVYLYTYTYIYTYTHQSLSGNSAEHHCTWRDASILRFRRFELRRPECRMHSARMNIYEGLFRMSMKSSLSITRSSLSLTCRMPNVSFY